MNSASSAGPGHAADGGGDENDKADREESWFAGAKEGRVFVPPLTAYKPFLTNMIVGYQSRTLINHEVCLEATW